MPLSGASRAGHVTAETTQNVTYLTFMGDEGLIRRSGARRLGKSEAYAGFPAILDLSKLC